MSKLNYLLPIALLASSTTFAASEDTWYTGARFGATHYDDISATSTNGTDIITDIDKNNGAVGAFLGYNFTPWFALEGSYTYLGELEFNETQKVKQQGFDLVGKFSQDLTNSLDVYAKAGASYDLAHGQEVLAGVDDKGLIGTAGLGLEYFFNDNASARVEYQYYHQAELKDAGYNAEWNTHFYGVSLVYTWGAEKAAPVMPEPVVEPVVEAKPVTIKPLTIEIYFANASAVIQPQYIKQLAPIAAHLIKYPQAKLMVVGHTDSNDTEQANQKLSERRAASVALYLAEEFKIDKSRVVAQGRGELSPIATNATEAGRAKNRRVSAYTPGLLVPAK
ncbi:MAG: OmpA family protein [Psychromonas sp.]